MASAAPSKSTGTFIAKRVVPFLGEIGCVQGDILVKSDQEPAIMSVVTEVGRVRAVAGGAGTSSRQALLEAVPASSSHAKCC